MPAGTPPRVFISYSHDDMAHAARVLTLANRLRADGIDANVDQYVHPYLPEGWEEWSEAQVRTADFVVMICTETYVQRFNRDAPPGVGRGVLWEAKAIRSLLYGEGAASKKFVPVLFSGSGRDHVPLPLRSGYISRIDTDAGYEQLYRLLTGQPYVRKPELGTVRQLPERAPSDAAASESQPHPVASAPHPRVEDIFVGRREEREKLAAALFPAGGTRRPVVVSGMPGVGKSYLVDRFYCENTTRFPGGYVRLALDPDNLANATDLLATVGDRLKLPAGDNEALASRLSAPLTLLHIENADSFPAGQVVGDAAEALPGCALVITARFRDLGFDAAWGQVPLLPFDEPTALRQLAAELGQDAPSRDSWPALAAALGHLPLALHLAAGYLRRGSTSGGFLTRLRGRNLALTVVDPADPTFRQRSRRLLSDTFDLSLDALRRQSGSEGEAWVAGLTALGHAPATGFGESLGAAISGLSAEGFEDMAMEAAGLSLLDRVPRGAGTAYRLHPLLAELVRPRSDGTAAFARMTEWFVTRLPEGGEDQGRLWGEIGAEIAALTDWLGRVPPADRGRVERAGSQYAMRSGPFHAWLRFCEEALSEEGTDQRRSNLLWTLGNVALRGGLPDCALTAAEETRELDKQRGDDRGAALAAGLIADIFEARGQLDEALKIRNEEQLPVYERLGDVRSRAVTMGNIADILQARGQLDEALKIRNEEQLPVYERLGDVRSRAVTMGKIADILQATGQFDEALNILKEEVLPAMERLGDVRSRAVAMGKIADILQARGQLDEALKIRQEDELPVYERLGDVRELLVGRAKMAINLLQRNADGDREEAGRLLLLALDVARRLKLAETQQIEHILEQAGLGGDEIASRSLSSGRPPAGPVGSQ